MCMQDDLTRLAQWTATWNLPLNVEKCSVLSVQSKCRHSQFAFSYHVNDTLLVRKTALTDLGVMLTTDLSWRNHYQLIIAKSYEGLGLLRRVFSSVHCPQAKKSPLYISCPVKTTLLLSLLASPPFV